MVDALCCVSQAVSLPTSAQASIGGNDLFSWVGSCLAHQAQLWCNQIFDAIRLPGKLAICYSFHSSQQCWVTQNFLCPCPQAYKTTSHKKTHHTNIPQCHAKAACVHNMFVAQVAQKLVVDESDRRKKTHAQRSGQTPGRQHTNKRATTMISTRRVVMYTKHTRPDTAELQFCVTVHLAPLKYCCKNTKDMQAQGYVVKAIGPKIKHTSDR